MTEINIPFIIIGLVVTAVGIWLMQAPRESKTGIFLGSMLSFRLLGVLFVLLGLFTCAVGVGLRQMGHVPITIH